MKKITQQELDQLDYCERGKGRKDNQSQIQHIIDEVNKLKPTEILKIDTADWTLKTTPRQRLRNAMPGVKFSVLSLRDESGWIVIKL